MRQPYTDILPGQTGGQGRLASLIDPAETYGRHIIERFVSKLPKVESVIDLGAGRGHDLGIIKSVHPNVRTTAIEAGKAYASSLDGKVDQIEILDIERDVFPFQNESIDLIIANQILEHTKEVFWIFHEVTRCLKIGGHFIFGVPNVASFHNRILLLFGKHPTQHKMVSAHVRPFTKADVLLFMNSCFPQGYSLESFAGSQFYPFPGNAARFLASIFPTSAYSIFFMIKKTKPYEDQFCSYPTRARLQTNFWAGGKSFGGQY